MKMKNGAQKILTKTVHETRAAAHVIARTFTGGTVVCLVGDLGAGKTTFAQGILEELGAERPYVSPTFVIMKQYDLKTPSATGIRRVYHADAYRVNEKDFDALGFSEWCADKEGVVILEWPERVKKLIPKNATHITFTPLSETSRQISIL